MLTYFLFDWLEFTISSYSMYQQWRAGGNCWIMCCATMGAESFHSLSRLGWLGSAGVPPHPFSFHRHRAARRRKLNASFRQTVHAYCTSLSHMPIMYMRMSWPELNKTVTPINVLVLSEVDEQNFKWQGVLNAGSGSNLLRFLMRWLRLKTTLLTWMLGQIHWNYWKQRLRCSACWSMRSTWYAFYTTWVC